MLVMANGAIEAREGIEIQPHVCLEGASETGKTLLTSVLYPVKVASIYCNDSKGVGACALKPGQRCLKFDDVGTNVLGDKAIADTIKTCNHNNFEFKEFGKKTFSKPMMVIITTNTRNPLVLLAGSDGANGLDAVKRRFVIANTDKCDKINFDQRYKMGDKQIEDIADAFIMKSLDGLRVKNLTGDLKQMYENVLNYQECEESSSDESSEGEEPVEKKTETREDQLKEYWKNHDADHYTAGEKDYIIQMRTGGDHKRSLEKFIKENEIKIPPIRPNFVKHGDLVTYGDKIILPTEENMKILEKIMPADERPEEKEGDNWEFNNWERKWVNHRNDDKKYPTKDEDKDAAIKWQMNIAKEQLKKKLDRQIEIEKITMRQPVGSDEEQEWADMEEEYELLEQGITELEEETGITQNMGR